MLKHLSPIVARQLFGDVVQVPPNFGPQAGLCRKAIALQLKRPPEELLCSEQTRIA